MSKKRILTLAVLLAAIATGVCYYKASLKARNMERFLAAAALVQIGSTTTSEWQAILSSHRVSDVVVRCQGTSCTFGLREENRYLRTLRLAPLTIADASVGFQNGLATEVYVALVVQRRNEKGEWSDDKGVVIREALDRPDECDTGYKVVLKQRYGVGERYWATVAMDRCATREARAEAFRLNTGCLSKIGACQTLESILPLIRLGAS